eukprot:13078201-Ditylum_brightwellii.AAC.1
MLRRPAIILPLSSVELRSGKSPCHILPRYSEKRQSSSSQRPHPLNQIGRQSCSFASLEMLSQMIHVAFVERFQTVVVKFY